jgi:predicted enzyme related to lactoylglutathione lyase
MARAVAFYKDVLGLAFLWGNGRLSFFQLGDVRIMLDLPEAPEFDHPPSILYFDVSDIDRAVASLTAQGVHFHAGPHHIGDLGKIALWMAFFEDSEGNVMALQCERPLGPTPSSSVPAGRPIADRPLGPVATAPEP